MEMESYRGAAMLSREREVVVEMRAATRESFRCASVSAPRVLAQEQARNASLARRDELPFLIALERAFDPVEKRGLSKD